MLTPRLRSSEVRNDYQKNLFLAVLDDFIENYAKRKTRSWRETERILRRGFAGPWRKLPVAQISKSNINYVLDGIVSRGTPSAANRAFAAIRKFLNWCVERGYLEHSPCSGMKAPSKVISRDRVLSDDELVAIWLAADKMGYPFGRLIQLLLLTAQRRSEVGGMRWEDIVLLKASWELIHRGTKSGRIQVDPSHMYRSLPRSSTCSNRCLGSMMALFSRLAAKITLYLATANGMTNSMLFVASRIGRCTILGGQPPLEWLGSESRPTSSSASSTTRLEVSGELRASIIASHTSRKCPRRLNAGPSTSKISFARRKAQ